MKLVFIENNRPLTDSLTVAEKFGKEHARVLRDIRELSCSEQFRVGNFAESTYVNGQGREMPKITIAFDGFMFLAMGYTGPIAAKLKEDYINEFNRMRDELNKPQHALPQTFAEALRLAADLSDKNQTLALKIETDKPLVLFAESLQVSKDSILVADLAKLLKQNGIDMGEGRLFKYLRAEGYLIKGGSEYNQPTQRSMDLKIMEVKIGYRGSSDGTTKITRTPKITGKGQVYFINKFKQKGVTA